jgi:hypothetical protein
MTIRQHLERYPTDEISLAGFAKWLVGVTWPIGDDADSHGRKLAHAIELALAEATSGLLSLDELRTELHTLLRQSRLQAEAHAQPA